MGLFRRQPAARYECSRLGFRADVIEPLADGYAFEVVTPAGTFRMTKAEFYRGFPNVMRWASERGLDHYPTTPRNAVPYLGG